MKYACIAAAAVALTGAVFSTAPAKAHASNCNYWSGPYCEYAHHAHHGNGWQTPAIWPQQVPDYTPVATYPYQHQYQTPWYPYPRYRKSYSYTVTTCRIESAFGCRFRTPIYTTGY